MRLDSKIKKILLLSRVAVISRVGFDVYCFGSISFYIYCSC